VKIKDHFHGKIVVLELNGNLMGGDETIEVHEKVKTLIQEGFVNIVIDLAKVKWMNSSGLGVLMSALSSCKNADGVLKIANVTDKVESLLMITQLTKIFHNYDSAEKAVASFNL
jgi:anti-sigma B factor antagonist